MEKLMTNLIIKSSVDAITKEMSELRENLVYFVKQNLQNELFLWFLAYELDESVKFEDDDVNDTGLDHFIYSKTIDVSDSNVHISLLNTENGPQYNRIYLTIWFCNEDITILIDAYELYEFERLGKQRKQKYINYIKTDLKKNYESLISGCKREIKKNQTLINRYNKLLEKIDSEQQ